MRKMKKVLAVILALLVLESVVPALAAYTTEDLDNMIIGYFYDPSVNWERTSYGRGSAMDITESARLDGHEYILRIMSDGTGVAEVSLSGWFPDLEMDGAYFPLGLHALTACVYAVDNLIPTRNVSSLISPYDIYEVLKAGELFSTYDLDGWRIQYISVGRIEASHDSGAYLVMSVNGKYFNFTYTS